MEKAILLIVNPSLLLLLSLLLLSLHGRIKMVAEVAGRFRLAEKRKSSEMLSIPFPLHSILLAPCGCSGGRAMSPNDKENLPRTRTQRNERSCLW